MSTSCDLISVKAISLSAESYALVPYSSTPAGIASTAPANGCDGLCDSRLEMDFSAFSFARADMRQYGTSILSA